MKHLKTGFTVLVFTIVAIVGVRSYLKYKKAKKAQQARVDARRESAKANSKLN